jgi:Rrf2 family transcriptional regulator, nitric oxide-sensitive transcriptional repressor
VRRTEGPPVPAECFEPGGGSCAIRRACHLRAVLQEAGDAFYAVLGEVTLADLVHNRPVLARMLHIQRSTSWPP